MAKLFVIGTPIGNLGDITYRAIETLKEVDLVVCEDTRVTERLLSHYEIKKPKISFHSQSVLKKIDDIIALLAEGKNLALVTDAGTPSLSDPGSKLIKKIREGLGGQVEIIPIPGPSALTAAISISGFTDAEFTFLGFLPHKKGRETLFKEIAESKRVMVFYESPHRFMKTLESLKQHLGEDRKMAVGRELTKIYEEFKIGTATEILAYYQTNPDKVRGEFVVLIDKRL